MSLCGVGHLEGQLKLLEANPDSPGQALFDRLPKDRQGNLRVPTAPSPFLQAKYGSDLPVYTFDELRGSNPPALA